jgi:1,4-alpha-glucan branching enzyme
MEKKKRVYFTREAPGADDVRVLGNFNDWSGRPLKKQKDGVWKTWTMLEPGTYEYRYLVDGDWTNAPEAEEVENPFGGKNCVERVS